MVTGGRRVAACALAIAAMALLLPAALLPRAASALSEARVYEQVSPEFKAGYPVAGAPTVALSGEAVRFNSIGAFNGSGQNYALNPYLARRGPSGWTSAGLFPPVTGQECRRGLEEASPELSRFEYLGSPGSTALACEASPTATFWTRQPNGLFAQTSPVLTTAALEETGLSAQGGSLDLARLIVANPQDYAGVHLLPQECGEGFEDEKLAGEEIFEFEACGARRVGVTGEGRQISLYCPTELGGTLTSFGAVSEPAAQQVFFSVAIASRKPPTGAGCQDEAAHPLQLFVRVDGEQTLTVSAPLAASCTTGPCKAAAEASPRDAFFQGASEDGSRVFFTTRQPLVDSDTDTGNDLYVATIGCSGALGEACGSTPREVISLTDVSYDPHVGESAEVDGTLTALSSDGTHAYFVAGGDLLGAAEREALEHEGRATPQPGARNLYVYEISTGRRLFIADLCSGPERSGSAIDQRCPAGPETETTRNDSGLWTTQGNPYEAQTTDNGRFLVFASYGQLLAGGPERDIDTARDIYRFDAQTDQLRRVSTGEDGADLNGNSEGFDATITAPGLREPSLPGRYELESRAISADGSTIVFSTIEPLSPNATNGQPDVYAWHDGRVSLISSGTSTDPDEGPVITPSGRDVFFTTTTGLVASDTDGLRDIYDARIAGGFTLPAAASERCSGDACQGPLSLAAPLPLPGSAMQAAGGNSAASRAAAPSKKSKGKLSSTHKPTKRASKPSKVRHKAKRKGKRR